MADTQISEVRTTSLKNNPEFSVSQMETDAAGEGKETRWYFDKWAQYFGYYKQIPELKSSIDAIAKWTIGRGFQADPETTPILNHISGYGEDTFNTILKNLIIVRQIAGDAFAEVIREDKKDRLANLKPLDTGSMVIVVDDKGVIKHYEQISKVAGRKPRIFQPQDILHLTKNRVADEIHGTSIIEAVEGIILKANEAIEDYQKVLHRNVAPIRIWEIDEDDPTKVAAFETKVNALNKDKENIIIPKGTVTTEMSAISSNATMNPLPWIQHLGGFFYQAVGIPQIILGGSQEFTEATAKIAYLAFQQSVEDEQRDIESQIWAQLSIKISLEFPASLENELLSDEKKDKTQGAIQPNDVTAGRGQ